MQKKCISVRGKIRHERISEVQNPHRGSPSTTFHFSVSSDVQRAGWCAVSTINGPPTVSFECPGNVSLASTMWNRQAKTWHDIWETEVQNQPIPQCACAMKSALLSAITTRGIPDFVLHLRTAFWDPFLWVISLCYRNNSCRIVLRKVRVYVVACQ